MQFGEYPTLRMPNSTNLCESRLKLVQEAIGLGCTHIQWFDTDMQFPDDTTYRLLTHNQDVVGINYSRKSAARRPTCYRLDKSGPLYLKHMESDIEEVSIMGFGATLMRLNIFEKIKKPWFAFPHSGDRVFGEDVYLCDKLREAGVKIYADTELSRECAHIGEYGYKLED